MKPINLYSSAPNGQLNGFLAAMGWNLGREVRLLPLTSLPNPDPQRRQALQVERQELLEGIQQAEFGLEQCASGAWQPDAGIEQGLRFDLEALRNRLRAVDAVLGTPLAPLPVRLQLEQLRDEVVRLVIKDCLLGLSEAEEQRQSELEQQMEALFPQVAQVLGWNWAEMTAVGRLRLATGNMAEQMLQLLVQREKGGEDNA